MNKQLSARITELERQLSQKDDQLRIIEETENFLRTALAHAEENYLFFGSNHGGERGTLLYGLIGTCRLNGIDPEAYLRHILSVLPEWSSNKVAELLPCNVDLTNK